MNAICDICNICDIHTLAFIALDSVQTESNLPSRPDSSTRERLTKTLDNQAARLRNHKTYTVHAQKTHYALHDRPP